MQVALCKLLCASCPARVALCKLLCASSFCQFLRGLLNALRSFCTQQLWFWSWSCGNVLRAYFRPSACKACPRTSGESKLEPADRTRARKPRDNFPRITRHHQQVPKVRSFFASISLIHAEGCAGCSKQVRAVTTVAPRPDRKLSLSRKSFR